MHHIRLLLWGSLFALLLPACSGNNGKPSDDDDYVAAPSFLEIGDWVAAYVEGNFSEYANHIHAFSSLPPDRQEDILRLYRQHRAERHEQYGHIEGYVVRHCDVDKPHRSATAYVDLIYESGDTVEILLPMVYVDDQWWRR